MNDTIKVGDRVWASGLGDGRMLAIHDDYGWVLWNTHDHCTARLDSLTRIEPEPVTLRPKYVVEQRVRTAQNKTETVIKGIFITYETTNLGTWDEAELEPVPEPCPECKGSGKASE